MNESYTINNHEGLLYQNVFRYTVKKLNINRQINDLITLKYNENENIPFELYDELPKKIKLWTLIKYRTPIQNFIIYQYSINAKTFTERKILKTTKSYCLRNMNTFPFKNFTFFFLITNFLVGHPLLKKYLNIINIFGSIYLSQTYWWLRNSRVIMLNFQINSFYKLGRESKEFIMFLENKGYGLLDKDPQNTVKNSNNKNKFFIKKDEAKKTFYICDEKESNIKAEFSRDPQYYKKFFVDEIFDVKFEKDDEIIDYLDMDINYDFHKEYLRKISTSKEYKLNSKDLVNIIR